MSPDFFSIMAARSLARVLPAWENWAKNARDAFKNASYTLPNITPKFLGYTINDFNLSNSAPQAAFKSIIDRISNEIVSTLVPNLQKAGMMFEDGKYQIAYDNMAKKSRKNHINYSDKYCLAQISNFNKLIAISNEKSVPIFDIVLDRYTDGQLGTLKWFKFLYQSLAERIIELTENEQ